MGLRRTRSTRSEGDFDFDEFGHRHRPGEAQPEKRGSLPALLQGPVGSERHQRLLQHQRHYHQHHHQHHQQQQQQLGGGVDGGDGARGGRLTRRELREMRRQRVAAARFRKSVRIIIIVINWINVLLKREDASVRAVDTLKGFSTEDSDLSFDLSYFRAKREIDLTGEMKAILQLEPHARTSEQMQTVMYGLQTLPTFNEYPLRTQEKLARVAFYQTVPAGRLIIRQGHIGINFYIIIRGRVIVSVMTEDRRTGETRTNIVARLGQGQSFGEVALLHQVARTASVVSQEPAQLLVIGREEFNDIFTRAEPGRLPGHVEFLAGCGFMRSFPVRRLLDQPSACLLTFYRRNALIAPDSKSHPHLVVVRSGSCRVVKNLRVPATCDDCGGEGATTARGRRLLAAPVDLMSVGKSEPKVDTWRRRPQAFAASIATGQPLQLQLQLQILGGGAGGNGSGGPGGRTITAAAAVVTRLHRQTQQQEEEESATRPELRRRLARGDPSDAAATVAVQVSTLKPGDVFGLSDVVFKGESNPEVEASASVALVSNGAECVLLSKAFFVNNASERVRRDVRELARPYPEEAVFEGNYRCQVAWDRYRRQLFREALRQVATRSK